MKTTHCHYPSLSVRIPAKVVMLAPLGFVPGIPFTIGDAHDEGHRLNKQMLCGSSTSLVKTHSAGKGEEDRLWNLSLYRSLSHWPLGC